VPFPAVPFLSPVTSHLQPAVPEERSMPDVVELLAELVAIPSVNPMGREVSGPEHGEARMGEHVARFLEGHGLHTERQVVLPGRENVLARVAGTQGGASVLFESHLDTVRVDQMEIEPFAPVQRDGRLHGRGSCDAKASLAAMMVAMARLAANRPPGDVWLCAAVDEEFTFGGAAHLVRSGFRVDGVVVGEPTGLQVVTAHKGAMWWRITTVGRAAHSATPWEGENAIYRMADVVQALREYAALLLREPPHPRLGPRTLSVGTIEGGQTVNTVPDRCTVMVDRRVIPGEALADVAAGLTAQLAERGLCEGVRVDEVLRDPPMCLAEDSPWVQRVLAAARSVLPTGTAAVHYGTDASKFAEAGMPALVLGPGDIAQAHTANEWVELAQVEAAARIYEAVPRAEW
jgi:acetylornithine deacetylase